MPQSSASPLIRLWRVRTAPRWTTVDGKNSREASPPDSAATLAAAGHYSPSEEIANWLTHGFGAVLSVAALMVLIVVAMERGGPWHVASFMIYGLSLVGLYTASTLYHLSAGRPRRWFWRRVDHAAIFLLIGGTYTPFLLTKLRGPWGWSLFGVIWALCGTGALLKILGAVTHEFVSTATYLFAGWVIVVAVKPMLAAVPAAALGLLLGGGLCYTAGVVFYLRHSLRFHHAIWHGFVLGGSACHFAAVLLLLPR